MNNAGPEAPLIRIDSEVTRRVRQHARAHMHTEVCGVFIGRKCDGIIEIEAPIEAFTAAQAGTHVTFTQDAWETIYRVKDTSYPEERIVGWYHSHPGFGVFLSEHDTFIHRNFFSSPDQVAWVYDPHSDEEGCFGWVDGSIHRIASISVADKSGDSCERARREMGPDEKGSGWDDFAAPTSRPTDGGYRFRPRLWISLSADCVIGFFMVTVDVCVAGLRFLYGLRTPLIRATRKHWQRRITRHPAPGEPPAVESVLQIPSNPYHANATPECRSGSGK